MRIVRPIPALAALLALAGCSSQKDKELEAVKNARSVAAEWAAVERLAAGGKLTPVYTAAMRDMAKDQLRTARASLGKPDSPAAHAIDAVRKASTPPPAQLEAAARALQQAEEPLEAR